jgi:hypothetical protein
MEKPTSSMVNLSDVRVIMMIMRVLLEELICQTVMGRIPVLKCISIMGTWVSVSMSYRARY